MLIERERFIKITIIGSGLDFITIKARIKYNVIIAQF